jgi:hypothetical protein
VLVAVSSNHADEPREGRPINRYPALFQQPNPYGSAIPNLIVVGSTDINGYESDFSQYADWMTTFAPGEAVNTPFTPSQTRTNGYVLEDGTSFGKLETSKPLLPFLKLVARS